MSELTMLRRLWQHCAWADEATFRALTSSGGNHEDAWREYLHVLGAAETWLSRIEQRAPSAPIWPTMSHDAAATLRTSVENGYASLLDGLDEEAAGREVTYSNSTGRQFTNSIGDIVMHAALHGQYHRGKMNLLLRQQGAEPAPVDMIAFIRGAPAATRGPEQER